MSGTDTVGGLAPAFAGLHEPEPLPFDLARGLRSALEKTGAHLAAR